MLVVAHSNALGKVLAHRAFFLRDGKVVCLGDEVRERLEMVRPRVLVDTSPLAGLVMPSILPLMGNRELLLIRNWL